MIDRRVRSEIESALEFQPAVCLLGPRQVGKTTLARSIAESRPSIYLDLEQSSDLAKLQEPALLFKSHEDKLLILDEVHRAPGLFATLRGVIDEGRRSGRKNGRFILLGSASLSLIKGTSESLAGRISYIDLSPFHILEMGLEARAGEQLWLKGGFPESYLQTNLSYSLKWRRDFIRTYLERDVPLLTPLVSAVSLERLWTMLAHRQGSTLNSSDLARSIEASPPTVTRYVDLLCDLLLVRRLQPYSMNVGKRLTKSPRVYIRDSGLVHALLGIESLDDLLGHPILGFSWEGFVIESICSILPWNWHAFFYRTAAGAEVDLVLETSRGERWAIEVKRSEAPRLEKGFHNACQDLKPDRQFVVYSGRDRFHLTSEAQAIGLGEICQEIAQG